MLFVIVMIFPQDSCDGGDDGGDCDISFMEAVQLYCGWPSPFYVFYLRVLRSYLKL